ncbi:unnamed protein product [Oppiella nova]|uniref:Glycoside hydrolase family 2 catalytic domain-containing protein n=1 Tax=Oppiella nova TaxID=334625 RepID=A0A7R9R034_9ACAR|nr:unnamed protein product [Oppiella nova]CAG2180571.1 unnamed protein product [Oppiella nova]
MIQRDKNRPSVVMWSIANEPSSDKPAAKDYFQKVSAHTRSLDKTRPITAATDANYKTDNLAPTLDVIMINRYYGWYSDCGYPQVIEKQVTTDFNNWYNQHKKPIMISEYGADTLAGIHMEPSYVFSEDYESEFLMNYHKAFDGLRKEGFFVGELVWNFADFMTGQSHQPNPPTQTSDGGTDRIIGNRKGIFTRERQPKAAARLLRCRYWNLAPLKSQQHEGLSYCPVV